MKKQILLPVFIVYILLQSIFNMLEAKMKIGIIEDNRVELANWKKGPANNRIVLPLFEKLDGKWKVKRTQLKNINWMMTFDSKMIGKFTSIANPELSVLYGETHKVEKGETQKLFFGTPNNRFSGWLNTDVHRPFVLVSNGGFKDSDKWKRFSPTFEEIKNYKKIFKETFPSVKNCNDNEKVLPGFWKYKNKDIQIGKRSYSSNKNYKIIELKLSGNKCGLPTGAFLSQHFVIKPDGSNENINVKSSRKSNEPISLTLVDAGDYDSNGESELIFFISGYNEDGYALFYNSFKNVIKYTWTYH